MKAEKYKDIPKQKQPKIGFWKIKEDGTRVAVLLSDVVGNIGRPNLDDEEMYLVS